MSKVHRFRALAGSWMSRTTTVGSPVTVPITMLSPAGRVPTQWTRVAGPGGGVAPGEVVLDGVVVIADAVAADVGDGVCDALGLEPPHPTTMRIKPRAAPLARTR